MFDELLNKLTEREAEIFDLVTRGFSCKEISQQLNISHRTVEVHRFNILKKSGQRSYIQLLTKIIFTMNNKT